MRGIVLGLGLFAVLVVELLVMILGRDSLDVGGVARLVLHALVLVLAVGFGVSIARELRSAPR